MTTKKVRKEAILVGMRIAEARRAAGLTQQEVANRVGCTRPYVARVETGNATPSVPSLWDWAAALGVDRGMLISDEPIK